MCKESWDSILYKSKVFYPHHLFFTPLFLHSSQDIFNKFQKNSLSCAIYIWVKLRGKKLVSGVKNFRFVKYGFSAFFCTKNHVKSFKTQRKNFYHIPTYSGFFFKKKPRSGNNRRHPLKAAMTFWCTTIRILQKVRSQLSPAIFMASRNQLVASKSCIF